MNISPSQKKNKNKGCCTPKTYAHREFERLQPEPVKARSVKSTFRPPAKGTALVHQKIFGCMASVHVNAADWQAYLSSNALSVLKDGLRVLEDRKVVDSDRAAKALFVLTAVIDNVRWLSNSHGQVNKAVADEDTDWNTFKQEAYT